MSQCAPNAAYTTPPISSRPGRCMAVGAWNGMPGVLSGVPWMRTGKPARSAPVDVAIACRYQLGWSASGPSAIFVVRYAVPEAGSITGVEVEPTFGTRSPQPRFDAG